jgi:hypothetical protein
VNHKESIEGECILIHTRKYIAQPPINKEGIGLLYKYRCQINSTATIRKELEEKKCKFSKGCHLNLDDSLEADGIEVLCLNMIRFIKQANYTSTHGIQMYETKVYTRAAITLPFRFVLERKGIQI